VTRPAGELLEIWAQQGGRGQVPGPEREGTAAAHIASSVSAQVYAEVIAQVLLADEREGEPDSLIRVVGELIERELKLGLDDARRQYGAPGGRARLVPWSWRLAGADEAFQSMTL